jgi:hypothetical protein
VTLPWLRQAGDDVVLTLHIQPGAKKTEVAGQHGEALKIRLAAPPVDGRANDCLIAFLAECLGLAKARLELVSGASSRAKRIRVSATDADTVRRALSADER